MPKTKPEDVEPEAVDEVTEGSQTGEWTELNPDLQDFLAGMFPGKTEYREVIKNRELIEALPKPGESDTGFPAGVPLNTEGLPPKDWVMTHFRTKSAAIRYLLDRGGSVNAIAKLLDVKYQHVRNVKVTELKRGPNEDWTKV